MDIIKIALLIKAQFKVQARKTDQKEIVLENYILRR